jgi:hypothetical protein
VVFHRHPGAGFASAGQRARQTSKLRRLGCWLPAILWIVGIQHSCTPKKPATKKPEASAVVRRDTRVVHEPCDIAGGSAEKLDANGDGKADVSIVKRGGRELCRGIDLNFDGKIDAWAYFDAQGRPRRRELAYGRDGRIVEIRIYQAGRLTQMQRVTTLSGKLDTWHFFKGERLVRTERDSDGNGTIDQWWEHRPAAQRSCPVIHADVNGDGRPDPEATVDMCQAAAHLSPDRIRRHTYRSPDFSRPGSLPTEQATPQGEEGSQSEPSGGTQRNSGEPPPEQEADP